MGSLCHSYNQIVLLPQFLWTFLLFCFFATSVVTAQTSTIEKKDAKKYLYVKFREESPTLLAWKTHGRKGECEALAGLLGKHDTKPLIDDGLLNATRNRFLEQQSEENPYPTIESLSRWCKVECTSRLDVRLLADKLRTITDVEFAEAQPERFLTGTPNDPYINIQTYLNRIRAFEAWDIVRETSTDTSRIIIGIVDSGIDYLHEDLAAVMYVNPRESGMDANGKDRRTNGIDDDQNGKIDDWRGWDLAGADALSEDNDPRAVINDHGTHVAGIAGAVVNNRIGVAGVVGLSSRVWLLPVKCSQDGISGKVYNGEKGALYAATLGAQIINCSWGSPDRSLAEEEVLNVARKLGAFIVCSAGNDGNDVPNYPGSYTNTFSVGWLNDNDMRAGGSSYNPNVDISAPGSAIYATFPENRYGSKSGTSMAAPQVAAAAALLKMRFPKMTADQIGAHLKATSDNIDTLNPNFAGLLGAGRLNMLRAVQSEDIPTVTLQDYAVNDENNNGILESGERITITLHVRAGQRPVQDAFVEMRSSIDSTSRFLPFWEELRKPLPVLSGGEIRRGAVTFSFKLTQTLLQDFDLPLTFTFRSASGAIIGRDGIVLIANLSYRTMSANNVIATITSTGGVGYNNYPSRAEGDGVIFKLLPSESLIYEGGLMIASSPDSISNRVRAAFSQRDRSFVPTSLIRLTAPSDSSVLLAKASFTDRGGENDAGVSVEQQTFQYRNVREQNTLIQSWKITNTSQRDFTSLYTGLFLDWDIGEATKNETYWDNDLNVGIVRSTSNAKLPVIAVQVLTPQTVNFMPIVWGDTIVGAIALNGFPRSDKYKSLSSGIIKGSKTGDISHVMSAGPIVLAQNASTMVNIAITIASSLEELRSILRDTSTNRPQFRLYPSPSSGTTFLDYDLPSDQAVSVDVVNSIGQVVFTPFANELRQKGRNQEVLNLTGLSRGAYFVRVRTLTGIHGVPLLISQ